jgi:two-component system chemotaxis response regulator CheY
MPDLIRMRFLIVDDMFTMRKMMRGTLASYGITDITEAKDGSTACDVLRLEAANGRPMQFIISDWNMPEMTGIDLLKFCRASEIYKNVAFVLVTAESDNSQAQRAMESGVDHYVTKPIDEAKFWGILQAIHAKKAAAR